MYNIVLCTYVRPHIRPVHQLCSWSGHGPALGQSKPTRHRSQDLPYAYWLNNNKSRFRQWPTWYTLALFYNTSTTILYMFRALHAHHQEIELYCRGIWYRPLSQWPSGAQVERELLCSSLSTSAPDGHWLRGRYQMLHQYNSASWWWACNARNM